MITSRFQEGYSDKYFTWRRMAGGCSTSSKQRSLATSAETSPEDTIVQYIVIRRDLIQQGWGTGPLMAQACHASTAALWLSRESEWTASYTNDLDHMHKVILSAKNEGALLKAAKNLEQGGVGFKMWIEQPENITTALATYPAPRSIVKQLTKSLQLFRD